MVHSIAAEEPFAVFDNDKNEKITDFQVVKKRIEQLTDKDAGNKKGIIEQPILLTVYSKNVPDLSMVDLPGITKIPIKDSDHPDNIEEVTKNLIRKYISDPRTIILCVVMGNVDVSTSDAIQLAKEYDKKGERTLCALTKLDLVSDGSDIRSTLQNQEVTLKYGYIGCKNRTPAEMTQNVTVQEGLKREQEYFRINYPDLYDLGLVGTTNLVNKMSSILGKNIQTTLPTIIKELKEKIDEFNNELTSLGTPLPESDSDKIQSVLSMVIQFCNAYENSIKGKYTKMKKDKKKEPIGVAIRKLLSDVFRDYKTEKLDSLLSDKLIKSTFVNFGASGLPGYPPFSAF